MSVCLIFGGRSAEHEVSITSARAIYQNLDKRNTRLARFISLKKAAGKWSALRSLRLKSLSGARLFLFSPGHQTASGQD